MTNGTCPATQPTWQDGPYGADKYVNWVGISANGNRVIAGTYYFNYGDQRRILAPQQDDNYGVYCYDRSKNLLFQDYPIVDPDGVYWVALSGDGNFAAAAGGSSTKGGFIRAYDVNASTPAQPKIILNYRQSGSQLARVSSVVLSYDGTWLAAGGDQLYIFQYYNGVYNLYNYWNTGHNIVSVAMSQSGQYIVFSDSGGQVYVVFLGKLMTRWSLPTPNKVVHFVSMSDDGQWFGAAGGDGRIYFFNTNNLMQSGVPQWSYPPSASPAPFYAVFVSASGAYVAAACNNGSTSGLIYLLDQKGNLLPNWPFNSQGNPNSVCMDAVPYAITAATGHPDGTPGYFYLLDLNAACYWMYQVDNMSWPMLISADASGIIAGSDTSCIYFWDYSSTKEKRPTRG